MDPKREGEIALKIVKYLLRERGIRLSRENVANLEDFARAIEVPVEELRRFAKSLIQELLDECLATNG